MRHHHTTFAARLAALPVLALSLALAATPAMAQRATKADRLDLDIPHAAIPGKSPAPAPTLVETVALNVIAILGQEGRLPGHLQRHRKALAAHYVEAATPPFWIVPGRMERFIVRLENAHLDGLFPRDYHTGYLRKLMRESRRGNALAAAYAELTFTTFYLRYASDLNTGRFVPRKIDPNLFIPHRKLDEVAALKALVGAGDPVRALDTLQPANPHYRALRRLLKRYHEIVHAGGWGDPVPAGVVLKPGMRDTRIPAIRARLARMGEAPTHRPTDPHLYDEQLAEAVRRFQRRHGLNDEGIIGKLTLMQLNIPARERLRQIIVNMERWRWMPQSLGRDHLLVNIAAFEMDRVANGRLAERIRVIVGKRYHKTPVFSKRLRYLVFNPTWTVPQSIARREMLPKLQRDPFHLAADFDVLRGGKKLDWASIDWTRYSPSRALPFTFRQHPGPRNALGRVKFMLPNRHAIYLHDTPARGLFARSTRAFSHGCIRVHRPLRLAATLLKGHRDWNRKKIDAIIASGQTVRVNLPKSRQWPVHIIYATSFARGDEVHFRPDIYGRDRKLRNALFAKPTP